MQNTGTWNSDLVLLFVFLFFLPIFITMLVNVFRSDAFSESLSHCQDVSPDVVGFDFIAEDNKDEIAALQAELKSVKKQISKLQTNKKKSKKHERNNTMIQEAAMALNKLGVKKSDANSMLNNLCKEKKYNSSEDLLKDAVVYIW